MQNPNDTQTPGYQGGKAKPGTTQPAKESDGERGNQEPSKQGGRPSPSGVPNEGRRSEAQDGEQQGSRDGQGGMQTPRKDSQGAYEYKGGRQGTGGIPNPDDADDGGSAGSFRGTADQDSVEEDDDVEKGVGAGKQSALPRSHP